MTSIVFSLEAHRHKLMTKLMGVSLVSLIYSRMTLIFLARSSGHYLLWRNDARGSVIWSLQPSGKTDGLFDRSCQHCSPGWSVVGIFFFALIKPQRAMPHSFGNHPFHLWRLRRWEVSHSSFLCWFCTTQQQKQHWSVGGLQEDTVVLLL